MEHACDDRGIEVDDLLRGALVFGFKDENPGVWWFLCSSREDEAALCVEFFVVLEVRHDGGGFFGGWVVGHLFARRGQEADELAGVLTHVSIL